MPTNNWPRPGQDFVDEHGQAIVIPTASTDTHTSIYRFPSKRYFALRRRLAYFTASIALSTLSVLYFAAAQGRYFGLLIPIAMLAFVYWLPSLILHFRLVRMSQRSTVTLDRSRKTVSITAGLRSWRFHYSDLWGVSRIQTPRRDDLIGLMPNFEIETKAGEVIVVTCYMSDEPNLDAGDKGVEDVERPFAWIPIRGRKILNLA